MSKYVVPMLMANILIWMFLTLKNYWNIFFWFWLASTIVWLVFAILTVVDLFRS